jgi:hypothetical protein
MWILAIIVRKFLIAITAVVFAKNSSFQMAACLCIMFLAYSAQMMARPYMNAGEYDEVLRQHQERALTDPLHARVRSQIANIETRGRKKARKNLLNADGKINRSAALGLLTSWLFNYNTIEQLMLFAAVIVCLMGIMYQANSGPTSSYYPGALDGVTAVVMITVISAIVYYFTMLFAEIAILYNEDTRMKQLTKQAKLSSRKASIAKREGGSDFGQGRLVGADGQIVTGNVDAQVNPLFMQAGGEKLNALEGLGVDSVMSMRNPPGPEMWSQFQAAFVKQNAAMEAMGSLLADSRRRSELGIDEAEAAEAPVVRSSKKKDFAPTTAATSSSLLMAKRKVSLRALSK